MSIRQQENNAVKTDIGKAGLSHFCGPAFYMANIDIRFYANSTTRYRSRYSLGVIWYCFLNHWPIWLGDEKLKYSEISVREASENRIMLAAALDFSAIIY